MKWIQLKVKATGMLEYVDSGEQWVEGEND